MTLGCQKMPGGQHSGLLKTAAEKRKLYSGGAKISGTGVGLYLIPTQTELVRRGIDARFMPGHLPCTFLRHLAYRSNHMFAARRFRAASRQRAWCTLRSPVIGGGAAARRRQARFIALNFKPLPVRLFCGCLTDSLSSFDHRLPHYCTSWLFAVRPPHTIRVPSLRTAHATAHIAHSGRKSAHCTLRFHAYAHPRGKPPPGLSTWRCLKIIPTCSMTPCGRRK